MAVLNSSHLFTYMINDNDEATNSPTINETAFAVNEYVILIHVRFSFINNTVNIPSTKNTRISPTMKVKTKL